jgi:hypothetical protein
MDDVPEVSDERRRHDLNLVNLLIQDGYAEEVAIERAAEWSVYAQDEGIEPTPDYVGKGHRWLSDRYPSKRA